jgi:hypothetical protein
MVLLSLVHCMFQACYKSFFSSLQTHNHPRDARNQRAALFVAHVATQLDFQLDAQGNFDHFVAVAVELTYEVD